MISAPASPRRDDSRRGSVDAGATNRTKNAVPRPSAMPAYESARPAISRGLGGGGGWGERAVPHDEREASLGCVTVDRARGRPRDRVPTVRDRLERNAETVGIAGRSDGSLVVPVPGRVQDLNVAAPGIGRLAELDPDLGRRLDETGVGGRVRSHV